MAEYAASAGCVVQAGTSQLTVVELIAAYLDYARGYYRKNGKPTRSLDNVKLGLRLLKDLYGTEPVATFSPLNLLAIQNTLVDKKASRKHVNEQTGIIKRVFRWGVSRAIVPPSVFTALSAVEGLRKGRTQARESKPVLPVDDATVDATLPHLSPIVADMVRFQRLTGARPGEVCQLRPCDVDRSGDVWTYRPESHKTEHHGRERIIYIGPQAQDVLRTYLLRDAQAHCFSPVESEDKRKVELRAKRKTRIQPSQRNRRKARPKRLPRTHYDHNTYYRAIARAVEKANAVRTKEAGTELDLLPHWHPNQLRHSAATEIRRRFGLEAAQVLLGHAKADTTQIYAERDAKLAVEVAKRIG